MENGQSSSPSTKRKIEQIGNDDVAPAAAIKIKPHDSLVEAAAVFRKARINKLILADPSQNHAPDVTECLLPAVSSLDDAYRIQDLILELYPEDSLVGWKVGATNQKALTALGLSEPLRGPLLSNYVHKNEAELPVLQWSEMGCSLLAAEVEFGFRMGSSLPERAEPYSEDEVWAAVSYVIPAIEIAATRAPSIVPLRAESVPAAMADYALSSAVVLGPGIPAAAVARSALPSALARLTLLPGGGGEPAAAAVTDDTAAGGGEKADGGATPADEARADGGAAAEGSGAAAEGSRAAAEGSGAGVLGDPLRSLAWLANHLARPGGGGAGGGGLRAGMVVITGAAALLGPDAVRWGRACRLRGALEGLGGDGGGDVTGTVEVRME